MTAGYPDWTRAIRLLAIDGDGNLVTILVDADGRMYSRILAEESDGTLQVVRVDSNGQMIMVPRGSTGNYMSVDSDGNLTSVMKGTEGVNLRPLVVDDVGNLVAVMKGLEGANLRTVAVDADGQIVMVPRGSSGNYMSIDSDGYMTAVLKGAYGAALRTIGLDDDGRITAYLVDDESQWGDIVKVGNAELAARLGSPVAYDWRGKVLWWTDFRNGIGGMLATTSGTGAAVAIDPTRFAAGGYSVRLTGGSDASRSASIQIGLDLPPTDRLGLYVRWSSAVIIDLLSIRMEVYDGAVHHDAHIRYNGVSNLLYYLDSDQAWQTLAAQQFNTVDTYWHGIKLVIDKNTDKYIRLLAGSTEHDMSALDVFHEASSFAQRFVSSVKLYSHTGDNDYAWIDAFIVTVGEPT